LQEKVLQYVKDNPDGVLQNQLGIELELDSKKCSKIIRRLVELGQVQRSWEKTGSVRTYRIFYNSDGAKPKTKLKHRSDPELKKLSIAGDEVFPCLGCSQYPEECNPIHCQTLDAWVYLLDAES
jgi:predicted transcriptional regulator